MKMRIDEALHLLLTTDRPLCDLALETGFCDQSAFTRHFRRMTGVPPGVFRGTRSQERGAESQEPGTKSQVGRGETASDSFAASD
jgi:AraC-like DNA-binding protein